MNTGGVGTLHRCTADNPSPRLIKVTKNSLAGVMRKGRFWEARIYFPASGSLLFGKILLEFASSIISLALAEEGSFARYRVRYLRSK